MKSSGVKSSGFFRSPPRGWPHFFVVSSLIIAAMVGSFYLFSLRFSIGVDPQTNTSNIGYRVFLIDHTNRELIRGKHYAFASPDLTPFYVEGTQFVKQLAAFPGDSIRVEISGQIYINGEPTIFKGLHHATAKLGMREEDFCKEGSLKEDQYWMLGDNELSFDSRYWGAISADQILGRAYAIL